MKIQWHPVFAQLLRPLVEKHFDVQTNVPVGDAPRQADVVLLRRTSAGRLPFQGLWRDLTTWNVLEFKGPTVAARPGHLDRLVELGLGIHRRLNEEREKQNKSPLPRGAVSFWYLANRLGRRFLDDCRDVAGDVEPHGQGVWRCEVLRRVVFLVSGTELPVDRDSLPLHVIGQGSLEAEREAVDVLAGEPALWEAYSGWLATLHSHLWEEVRAMAKTTGKRSGIQLKPVIEMVGVKEVINQIGVDRVVQEIGLKRVIDEVGIPQIFSSLTPAQRKELKKLLQ
jgi:hypothetical protein